MLPFNPETNENQRMYTMKIAPNSSKRYTTILVRNLWIPVTASLFFTSCWYGMFQSARILPCNAHEFQPIVAVNSQSEERAVEDVNNAVGLRYSCGYSEHVNLQVRYVFSYSLFNPLRGGDHHAAASLKQGIRNDKVAFLYTIGYEHDPYMAHKLLLNYAPIFSIKTGESLHLSLIPLIGLNLNLFFNQTGEFYNYIAMPTYSFFLNLEKQWATMSFIPEIAVSNIGLSLWSVSLGFGVSFVRR